MQVITVNDVLTAVNEIAPFETAEKWDNVGLLMGSGKREVKAILCALDLNRAVLREAQEKGANLIVTHHPILFSGRKNLCEDETEASLLCDAVRGNINLIAAHTNFDAAPGGVNDCLARELGLRDVTGVEDDEEGFMRMGRIEPMTLKDFAALVTEKLGDVVRVYGDREKTVEKVALVGGSGGEFAALALRAGADVYLTGEMRYHDSVDLAEQGLATLHCGHDATERIAIKPLANGLQNRLNEVQYKVNVYVSKNMGVEK